MKNLPRISIVTPSYNQGEFIEETICSVLDQNYPNLEYVIVDGGSTDQSVEIIRKYQKHLKYWVSEKDNGQSHAINKGLRHCTGDVFNWLNSDDLFMPHTFETVGSFFERNEDLKVLSGRELHFDSKSEWVKYGTKVYPTLEHNIFHSVFYQPSTFWKMSVVKEFGVNNDLHYLMDTFLWVQFLLNYGIENVLKIDDVLAKFRLHVDSKSVDQVSQFSRDRWSIRTHIAATYSDLDTDMLVLGRNLSSELQLSLVGSKPSLNKELIKKMFLEELYEDLIKNKRFCDVKQVSKQLLRSEYRWQNLKRLLKSYLVLYMGN